MSQLDVRKVVAGHGEILVLRDFSLSVEAGSVHCITGRNGAGKSTLMNVIAGLVPLQAGELHLAGTNISEEPAFARPVLGIGYVPQGRRLFGALSVAENLDIAAHAVKDVQRARPGRDALLSRFPVLGERLDQRAETLSGGEQQMLATARALAIGPSVLLMDEPTEGLQPSLVGTIRDTARSLAEDGVTVVLVEQRLDEVLDIVDHVTFMENGAPRVTHTAAEVQADPAMVRRLLGVG